MKMKKFLGLVVASLLSATAMNAQSTITDMEVLTVNENVTTIITASEPIRFVDISTDMVAGDQPIENTIRLKPKEGKEDGEILGIVTIVTARFAPRWAASPCVKVVFPAPRSPSRHTTSPGFNSAAKSRATRQVSSTFVTL